MNRIKNQTSIIMIHNRFYIKCVKIIIIAEDTCYNEIIYMFILYQIITFYSFLSFLKL